MPAETSKRCYWKESDAVRVVGELEQSGLTIAEFARRHGESAQRLKRWRKRLGLPPRRKVSKPKPNTTPPITLLPVRIREQAPAAAPDPVTCAAAVRPSPFELLLGNGRTLRVPVDFDAVALSRLLGVLEPSC